MKSPKKRPLRQLSLFDAVSMTPPEPKAHPTQAAACNYWDYCPNCSTALHNAGCKYRCPKCHYFMSCSDFD